MKTSKSNLGNQYRNVKDQADKANARATKAAGSQGVYFRYRDGTVTDFRSYEKDSNIVLKDVQKTAIDVMERMSKIMGVRFNVFESWEENGKRYYLDENGVKTEGAPNGFYDPRTGEIYIDLAAGNDFQGTMLFTVAHELTHFMRQWSPEHFTKIARIVFKHGGMKGNVSALVAAKQAKAKAKGKPISYDTAMEEAVADGMETILKDPSRASTSTTNAASTRMASTICYTVKMRPYFPHSPWVVHRAVSVAPPTITDATS